MAAGTKSRPQAVSKTAWANLAQHTITLPSGAVIKARIPNLAMLVATDAVPEALKGAALHELATELMGAVAPADGDQPGETVRPTLDEAMVRSLVALQQWIVTQAVVEPEVTEADLPGLPQEDLEMLVQIATRERDVDARGVRLGVEPLSRFETFRAHHECPEGCKACEAVLVELSTVDVGRLPVRLRDGG